MNIISTNDFGSAVADRLAPVTDYQSPFADPQLELSLAGAAVCRSMNRRGGRVSRANWWFERMRQIVDRACDWQPAPAPRPEQTWFPNAYRQAGAAPQPNPDERQICE